MFGDRLGDHVRIEKLKITGIIDDAAHQVTGLLVMEEAQVHTLQLVIDFGTEIADQVPGRLMCQIIAHKTKKDAQQVQPEQDQYQYADRFQARLRHAGGDDAGHPGQRARGRQVHEREPEGRADRQDIQPLVADRLFT